MVDRQVTGGYTKIATVITPDISKLGQMKPGDKIRFHEVSLSQGQQLMREEVVPMYRQGTQR
jgi:allophanate hydrolase subunit 2